MSDPRNPPIASGVIWRPPTFDDAPRLADHTRLIHESERLHHRPGPGFFEWLLRQPGIDRDHDILIADTEHGIVADAGAWLHTSETEARCFVWAEAAPDHIDLKPSLLAWAEARARQRLGELPDTMAKVIRIAVESHRVGHRAVIEAAGFQVARTFVEMARPLDDLPRTPTLPDEIEVVTWSDDLEESTRLANNEAFGDHWGSVAMSTDEFRGLYRDSPSFRPGLSFLALDRGRVASFCLCEVDEEDNAERDTDDLYIARVGTVARHRGRGLATRLILEAMQAGQALGLDRAALEVDETSHTNATLVYERLGFSTYARNLHYVKRP